MEQHLFTMEIVSQNYKGPYCHFQLGIMKNHIMNIIIP